jgi:hypothetical protein
MMWNKNLETILNEHKRGTFKKIYEEIDELILPFSVHNESFFEEWDKLLSYEKKVYEYRSRIIMESIDSHEKNIIEANKYIIESVKKISIKKDYIYDKLKENIMSMQKEIGEINEKLYHDRVGTFRRMKENIIKSEAIANKCEYVKLSSIAKTLKEEINNHITILEDKNNAKNIRVPENISYKKSDFTDSIPTRVKSNSISSEKKKEYPSEKYNKRSYADNKEQNKNNSFSQIIMSMANGAMAGLSAAYFATTLTNAQDTIKTTDKEIIAYEQLKQEKKEPPQKTCTFDGKDLQTKLKEEAEKSRQEEIEKNRIATLKKEVVPEHPSIEFEKKNPDNNKYWRAIKEEKSITPSEYYQNVLKQKYDIGGKSNSTKIVWTTSTNIIYPEIICADANNKIIISQEKNNYYTAAPLEPLKTNNQNFTMMEENVLSKSVNRSFEVIDQKEWYSSRQEEKATPRSNVKNDSVTITYNTEKNNEIKWNKTKPWE